MPRRKKGRDKPRGKRRQRKPKNLFTLNVQPVQRVDDPKRMGAQRNPYYRYEDTADPKRTHTQRTAYAGGTFEDAVVVSHLLKPRRIELDEVDLEQMDRQPERVRKRRARRMFQLDAYNLVRLGTGLKEYQQYKGAIDYAERGGFWHILLYGLNVEIGVFETESKARKWAWEYLGRV